MRHGARGNALCCPSKVVIVAGPAKVSGTPKIINNTPPTIDIGSKTRVMERVKST
jgi:histidinol dehydrogenase